MAKFKVDVTYRQCKVYEVEAANDRLAEFEATQLAEDDFPDCNDFEAYAYIDPDETS